VARRRVVAATATFDDTYAGRVAVELRTDGTRALWCGVEYLVAPGYRPVTVERAIALARYDRRFSDVRESRPC
jgi:hypothetical protein